jgi:hypothetical protein
MLIENFLPNTLANKIEKLLWSNNFEWGWNSGISLGGNVSFSNKDYQFIHLFTKDGVDQSPHLDLLKSLVDWFEYHTGHTVKFVWRIKANLTVRHNYSQYELDNLLHNDFDKKNCLSMIYYVSDSDGDTLMLDNKVNVKQRFTPKKNTAVWFKSSAIHRPTPPKINGARIVINYVLEVNEDLE